MNRRRLFEMARRAGREARDLAVAFVAVIFSLIVFLIPGRVAIRLGGYLAPKLGMRLPRLRRVGMHNLSLAFPEKTLQEREEILRQSWDNMGRTAVEYFFIDGLWDFDPAAAAPGRIEIEGVERFVQLANDGKPAIILSAHLANWELPMVAAAKHGLQASALFNRPRNRWIARMVMARRRSTMGDLVMAGPGALHRLRRYLEAGGHVGLLVDQFYEWGPKITLFGHQTDANPVFARLARQLECPVHTVRVVRLPHGRFRIDLSEALDLPRDASGRIDVAASAQMVGTIIEGWVREHPGQWLWVHRRWRPPHPVHPPQGSAAGNAG